MTRAQQWVGGQLQQTIDYAYDVLGRRIQRHATDILGGNSTERYGYDGDNVLLDLTGGNALSVRRLFGGGSDEVLSRESAAGALTWYLSDRQGSVIGLAAAAGALIGVTSYDGFGNIQSDTTGASGDRYRWTGREMDFATGEQFNRARYYDPALGKWTTQDPEGFAAGDWDLYRYVGNNATDAVDPSGKDEISKEILKEREERHERLRKMTVDELRKEVREREAQLQKAHPSYYEGVLISLKEARAELELREGQRQKTSDDGSNLQWISESKMEELVSNKLAHVVNSPKAHRVIITAYGDQIRAFDYKQDVNPAKGGTREWAFARSYPFGKINDLGDLQSKLQRIDTDATAERLAKATDEFAVNEASQKGLAFSLVGISMIPGGGSAEAIDRGDYVDAVVSFVGDVALLGGFWAKGVAKAAAMSKAEGAAAKLAGANRALLRFRALEGAIAITRLGQAGFAVAEGDDGRAGAYFGEALLRIFGIAFTRKVKIPFEHSSVGGLHTIGIGQGTRVRFSVSGNKMFVDMWEVAPQLRKQGFGRALFEEALAKNPNVNEIRGVAELDNLAALRKTGDVSKTPFGRAVAPLGFRKFYAENSLGRQISDFANIRGEIIIGAKK